MGEKRKKRRKNKQDKTLEKWRKFVTHMSKKVKRVAMVKASILLATHYLQEQHSEAEHIRFNGEKTFQGIFRRHVTTIFHQKSIRFFIEGDLTSR